jgi:hemerythrin-like metal-binding protein
MQRMDSKSTGLERLDHDHQELFRQLSELRLALRSGLHSEVAATLAFVRGYVDAHFEEEEREMLATGYPLYHVHRAAHGRLGREVRVLEAEWKREGVTPVLAASVLEALTAWFEQHVLELDALLVRHLRTRDPRVSTLRTAEPAAADEGNLIRLPRVARR